MNPPKVYRRLIAAFGPTLQWSNWVETYFYALVLDTGAVLSALLVPVLTAAALDVAISKYGEVSLKGPVRLFVSDFSSQPALVTWLCGVAIVSTVISVVCATFSSALLASHVRKTQSSLRERVLQHLLGLPLSAHLRISSSAAVTLVRRDASAVAELARGLVYVPIKSFLQLLGTGVAVASVDLRLPLVALVIMPLVWLTHWSWNLRVLPSQIKAADRCEKCDSRVLAAIRGLRVVRIYGREQHEVSQWKYFDEEYIGLESKLWWEINLVRSLWDLLLPAIGVIVLWLARSVLMSGAMTAGDVLLFTVCIGMLASPMHAIAESLGSLQASLASLFRVLDVMAIFPETTESEILAKSVIDTAAPTAAIKLKNVGFCYESQKQPALEDISLSFSRGEVVAIVGANGSGKTTVLNLIAGFYEPSKGALDIYGKSIKGWGLANYRRHIAMVEQDVYLFPGTLRENILYSVPDASDEDVCRAIDAVGASSFLRGLSGGVNARVGDGEGCTLSGGQLQRLAIARAILRNPRILLLDECSSHLDPRGEADVFHSILRSGHGTTIVIVTHHESIAAKADVVIFLEAGRVSASGNHQELLETADYANFWLKSSLSGSTPPKI